jgi:adenylate kinase
MERGAYVPDEVTIKMVMDWISNPAHSAGFVLDGFPRTHAQAEALDAEMKALGGVDRVIFIKVSEDELIRRLTGRQICRDCQTPYHIHFSPSKTEGKCDNCGGELYQRDDDKADVVTTRIQVYNQETEPVVDYYRQAGILREVDGEQDVGDVGKAMNAAIGG